MREIMNVDLAPKALTLLTGIPSLALLIYVIYGESYWSGFGLVLLMTSLLLILSLSGPKVVVPSQAQERRSIAIQTPQVFYRALKS